MSEMKPSEAIRALLMWLESEDAKPHNYFAMAPGLRVAVEQVAAMERDNTRLRAALDKAADQLAAAANLMGATPRMAEAARAALAGESHD